MQAGQQHDTTIAQTRLTSARGCAIVDAMNRARLSRLPLGGGLPVPSLFSGRQALAPVDKPAGGGRSYQCRGGSDRHVGSLLGGAFKPSRLAGGCHWLPALSGARAGSHFSGLRFRLACSASAPLRSTWPRVANGTVRCLRAFCPFRQRPPAAPGCRCLP